MNRIRPLLLSLLLLAGPAFALELTEQELAGLRANPAVAAFLAV